MRRAQYPKGDSISALRVARSVRGCLRVPWLMPALLCSLLVGVAVVDGSWLPLSLVSMGALAMGQRLLRLGLRRLDYSSGDFRRVSAALSEEWSEGTASRRLRALAMVGLGDFAAARRELLSPRDSNHEDRELRLCAHIVMLAFEGQALSALRLCTALVALPLVAEDGQERRRRARREGIVAIARALGGAADEEDYQALILAARWEPALHWPCCYGAAVACYVKSEPLLARKLVERAPRWPQESIFRGLHSRLFSVAPV